MKQLVLLPPLVLLAACGQPAPSNTAAPDAAATAPSSNAAAPAAGATVASNAVAAAPANAVTETAAADAQPAAFAPCKACHLTTPDGRNSVGPNLHGVYGTVMGTKAGYSFSPAMAAKGLKLDDAGLDAYLKEPMTVVPGTKMAFSGVADAAKRQEIIAYLKTLK